jgi:hypothetical protein
MHKHWLANCQHDVLATTMFEKIDAVTKHLQTKLLPLSAAQMSLDMLIKDVDNSTRTHLAIIYERYHLGMSKIAADEDIVANPDFEQAVVKIQLKQFATMTDSEKEAAAPLHCPQPQAHAQAACFTWSW